MSKDFYLFYLLFPYCLEVFSYYKTHSNFSIHIYEGRKEGKKEADNNGGREFLFPSMCNLVATEVFCVMDSMIRSAF